MDGFNAENWAQLSNAERIELCRAATREAESYARSTQPALRAVYENLAEQWLALASEIERAGP